MFPTTSAPATPALVCPWHGADCRHLGRALLDAQLWCLGQDILHPDGNLLAAYGAERWREGLAPRQPSAYRHRAPAGARVALWGYGLWLGDPSTGSGCFVRRKHFVPVLTDDAWPGAAAFVRDDRPGRRPVTPAERDRLAGLLCHLARWCGDYERWIAETQPADWRATCEVRRPRATRRRGRLASAETLDAGWARLAALVGAGAGDAADVRVA
jgi:hypothetical protein